MKYKHDIFAVTKAIRITPEKGGRRIFYEGGNVLAPKACKIKPDTDLEIYHPVNSLAGKTLTDLIISNPPGICAACQLVNECEVLAKGAVQGKGLEREFLPVIEV